MVGTPQESPVDPSSLKSLMSKRTRLVAAAHSPLGFFVLALLIVEAFLWGGGVWFQLPETWKIVFVLIGVLLFLVVFGTVVWLVVRYPQNLVFSEDSHVQYEAMRIYGTEAHRLTANDINAPHQISAPQAPLGQTPILPDQASPPTSTSNEDE